MTNDDCIAYSTDGYIDRALFFEDYNSINIFIEDVNKEYIYETIFDRMFEYNINITSLLPTGGKKGMKQAFEDFGSHINNIPNLYIADADFDFLLDKDIILDNHFLYLDFYNIECYFLDKNAVTEFMKNKTKKRKKETADLIKYNDWNSQIFNQFLELFIIYMVVQKQIPSEKNVGLEPNSFLNNNGFVNTIKVNEYKSKIIGLIPSFNEDFTWCNEQIHTKCNDDYTKVICGKYILKSLYRYLLNISNINFKYEEFFAYLIGRFDITPLNFIKEKIITLCA